jgi:hypothetical protein
MVHPLSVIIEPFNLSVYIYFSLPTVFQLFASLFDLVHRLYLPSCYHAIILLYDILNTHRCKKSMSFPFENKWLENKTSNNLGDCTYVLAPIVITTNKAMYVWIYFCRRNSTWVKIQRNYRWSAEIEVTGIFVL